MCDLSDFTIGGKVLVILPCKPKDKIYRIWPIGDKRVVASFTVEKFSVEEDGIYCIVTSNRHIVRRWNIDEFGKTLFLNKEDAEEELRRQEENNGVKY